ncbi:MAG: ABC transporter substrate-binding protein [Candidatus Acidiferrales bacterium]
MALTSCAALSHASTDPEVGGTLRVELAARVATLDPRQPPSSPASALAQERLDALLFDRLVRFNERGALEGALATSWKSEEQDKRWRFQLRPSIKFSDGTPLTADVAAQVLAATLGSGFQVNGNALDLIIEAPQPTPDLPERLATGRNFIFRVESDGSLAGTGPFTLDEWTPDGAPGRAIFVANRNCWAGRPFVDRIEVSLGVEPQRIEADLEFGLADVADLSPAELRRAAQRGARTWSSKPVELLALVFDSQRPAVQDARLREGIALAVDRNAIASAVLQRQAVAAGGLLPQWISGYAFLFPTAVDTGRAISLVQSVNSARSPGSPAPAPLLLVYDASDAEARAVAERVAVNLRDAGITMQAVAEGPEPSRGAEGPEPSRGAAAVGAPADARLVRVRITSPEPRAALLQTFEALGIMDVPGPNPGDAGPEALYTAERSALAEGRVIPLVHEMESCGLSVTLRDWMAMDTGEWRLDDVWLSQNAEGSPSAPAASGGHP